MEDATKEGNPTQEGGPNATTPAPTAPPTKTQEPNSTSTRNAKLTKPSTGKKRSWVWDHFSKIEGDEERAACNYCKTTYACSTKLNGTSSMACHLETKCKKYPFRKHVKGQTTLGFQPSKDGNGGNLVSVAFNLKACRRALSEMIILDELPFMFVEKKGFRQFMSVVCPKWTQIPSRSTVARDCLSIFMEEKDKLRNALKGQRVCLTTDTWTSTQNLNYMCLTAHFIDCDWKLHKRIINFCLVESHKGEMLGQAVELCLLGWHLQQFLCITVDNASSNNLLVNFLKKKTKSRKGIVLEHEFLHVRCCAHILNLIVCEGLKEYDDSIARVRNAVRYVRSSPSRLNVFKLCAEKEQISYTKGLCLDVPTRWNSTYEMLNAAEKYQKVFERLEDEDPNFLSTVGYGTSEEGGEGDGHGLVSGRGEGRDRRLLGAPAHFDWERVRMFVQFLKLFKDATLKFSGSLHVTCNTFFEELVTLQAEINAMCTSDDVYLKSMAMGMKTKFQKYWGNLDKMNLLLFIGVVLDPRYKLRFVSFCFSLTFENEKVVEMTRKVKDALVRLYGWYASNQTSCSSQAPTSSQQSSPPSTQPDTVRVKIASQFRKHLEEQDVFVIQTDVDKYLGEACEPENDKFDLLAWWKNNSCRFQVLSQVARDILAIPVSTVASESAFSTGGRVLDSFRSSLSPLMVEAIICAQNWLQASSTPINLQASMDGIEEMDKVNLDSLSYETDDSLINDY